MPRTYFSVSGDAGYRLDGRLSFAQLLLILSCVIIENSLPATLGDRRQIHDLLTRCDSDWCPCIGSEAFDAIKQKDWRKMTPVVQQFWETIQRFMVQQKLCELQTSAQTIREHLCHLLCRVEQISAQELNALCIPRTNMLSPMVDIDSRAKLALVCISLSVAPAPFLHGCRIWQMGEREVDEMLLYLQESPLFSSGISSQHILSALFSLEFLLSGEEDTPHLSANQPWSAQWDQRKEDGDIGENSQACHHESKNYTEIVTDQ